MAKKLMSIIPNVLCVNTLALLVENTNIRPEMKRKSQLIRIGRKREWRSNGGEPVALKPYCKMKVPHCSVENDNFNYVNTKSSH